MARAARAWWGYKGGHVWSDVSKERPRHWPCGETLSYRSTTLELGRTIKNYRTSACGRCALKPRCTRNQDGRKLTQSVDEHLLEEMAVRLQRDRAFFAQRKALAARSRQ